METTGVPTRWMEISVTRPTIHIAHIGIKHDAFAFELCAECPYYDPRAGGRDSTGGGMGMWNGNGAQNRPVSYAFTRRGQGSVNRKCIGLIVVILHATASVF